MCPCEGLEQRFEALCGLLLKRGAAAMDYAADFEQFALARARMSSQMLAVQETYMAIFRDDPRKELLDLIFDRVWEEMKSLQDRRRALVLDGQAKGERT